MTYGDYMSGSDVVLSVAPTAPEHTREDASLPVTPDAIAEQVADCATQGATIASVYGWTADGAQSPSALPDVATEIRDRTTDVLIEYAVGPECPLGDYLAALDSRPHPDLAQLRITPTQYGQRGATRRTRKDVDSFIEELTARNIKPNLLIQGGRDVQELYRLLQADMVTDPLVTLRLGARDGTVATPLTLMALVEALPSSASVLVAATGPNQYPLTTMAVFLGANVRTGMADNRYLAHEDPVVHNEQLVRRVTEVVSQSERALADYATVKSDLTPEKRRVESS
jgi:3-keto-5-aminohexanoate cleavage enzyme